MLQDCCAFGARALGAAGLLLRSRQPLASRRTRALPGCRPPLAFQARSHGERHAPVRRRLFGDVQRLRRDCDDVDAGVLELVKLALHILQGALAQRAEEAAVGHHQQVAPLCRLEVKGAPADLGAWGEGSRVWWGRGMNGDAACVAAAVQPQGSACSWAARAAQLLDCERTFASDRAGNTVPGSSVRWVAIEMWRKSDGPRVVCWQGSQRNCEHRCGVVLQALVAVACPWAPACSEGGPQTDMCICSNRSCSHECSLALLKAITPEYPLLTN